MVFQARVHLRLAAAYYTIGDYHQALQAGEWSITALEGERLYERYGVGIASVASRTSRNWLSLCCAELCTFREGLARANEALQIAAGVKGPFSLVQTYRNMGLLAMYQGDLRRAMPLLARAMGLYQSQDIMRLFRYVAAALGMTHALSGHLLKGYSLL